MLSLGLGNRDDLSWFSNSVFILKKWRPRLNSFWKDSDQNHLDYSMQDVLCIANLKHWLILFIFWTKPHNLRHREKQGAMCTPGEQRPFSCKLSLSGLTDANNIVILKPHWKQWKQDTRSLCFLGKQPDSVTPFDFKANHFFRPLSMLCLSSRCWMANTTNKPEHHVVCLVFKQH